MWIWGGPPLVGDLEGDSLGVEKYYFGYDISSQKEITYNSIQLI